MTYQVSGLKNGDTAGAVLNGGGLVRVSGENVGNYAIQQGGLGLVSGNYDLAYQGNNLTITREKPREWRITASGYSPYRPSRARSRRAHNANGVIRRSPCPITAPRKTTGMADNRKRLFALPPCPGSSGRSYRCSMPGRPG